MRFHRYTSGAALAFLLIAGGGAIGQQQIDCQAAFTAVRSEYEKRGKAVEAANKRKAGVAEACALFKPLHEAQSKMLKFLKDNRVACSVPDDILKNLTAGVAKTGSVKTQVCNMAAAGDGAVRPPSAGLSGAINITGEIAPPPGTAGGGGVFDTLNGNILQR